MKVSGSYQSNVPRKQLWDALMDPAAVESCIPGVKGFKTLSPDEFEIEVRVGVGAVSGSYRGKLEITGRCEPESYSMSVSAKGSMTTIKGQGTMRLAEVGEGTELSYEGEALVTGMLARVGQRLMGNVAKTQIDRFFDCLSSKAAA